MEGLKIKTEFLNTVIGFNNSDLPLGKRNDIHLLAEMAVNSKDESLLNLFEEQPTYPGVEKIKEEKFLEETADEIQPTKESQSKRKQQKAKPTKSEK